MRETADFVLNQLPFSNAGILVANSNFGCGSSREGAAYALFDSGFRSVIAPSFGDIFFNNCLKNGIVPVRLPDGICSELRVFLKNNPGSDVTVDLESQAVTAPTGKFSFEVNAFFREMLLEGVDEMGLTLSMLPQIEAFEITYFESAPWAGKA